MNNKKVDQLGDCIRILRINRGLTQEVLTEDVCDRTLLSHLENGDGMCPTVFVVQTFAERLGLSLNELLDTADMGNNNYNVKIKREVEILLCEGRFEDAKHMIDNYATWRYKLQDDQFFRYVYGRYYYSVGQLELAKDMFLDSIKYTDPLLKLKKPNQRELLSLVWHLMCEIETGYTFCRMKLSFERKMRAVVDNIIKNFSNKYSYSYIELVYFWALLLFKIEKYSDALYYLELVERYCVEGLEYRYYGKVCLLLSKCYHHLKEYHKMRFFYYDAERFFKLFDKRSDLEELEEFKILVENEKVVKI